MNTTSMCQLQTGDTVDSKASPNCVNILTGLQPAYKNIRTGESHLAQCEPGIPASEYGFAGLPDDWVVERDSEGEPTALHPDIVPGYWRDARFIELSQFLPISNS